MSVYDSLAHAIDKAIGLFSPKSELQRAASRRMAKRMYAAAQSRYNETGGWRPAGQTDVNDLISSSSPYVRERVRQLVRDFPIFSCAVDSLVSLYVGTGFNFQSRVKRAGRLNKDAASKIEDAWNRWMDEADASGKLHFFELLEIEKRQECECGESILMKVDLFNRSDRFLPFALMAIEPDRLTDLNAKAVGNNKIQDGIEYNPATGETVAYHIESDDFGKVDRVPASKIIHNFKTVRPGQRRGISPFASAVLLADNLADYINTELDNARKASKWLAFVKTADPQMYQQMREVYGDTDTDKPIEDLENSIIEYLQPGEDITLSSSDRPGNNFEPFVRLIIRLMSVSVGVPYEMLSGDYSGLSYSNAKMIKADVFRKIRPQQNRQIKHTCQPVFNDVLEQAVLYGKISLLGYGANRERFRNGIWIPNGIESPDPLRDAKADREQFDMRTLSPQEIAARRGRSLEEILDEFVAYKKMLDERGLTFDEGSTAMANSPSALGASEEK